MSKKNPESIAICLNCYKIKFTEKNKGLSKDITSVFGHVDIVKIMQSLVKDMDLKKVFKNKKKDRIIYFKDTLLASASENVFAGVLMKGHNGPQTSIDELAGSEVKTVGTVSKDQYHCLPYFFLFYVNKKHPTDILFLAQSYRQFGFKEVFEESFRAFVEKRSNLTTTHFNPLSVASLFEKYVKEGKINKIRFIKYGLQKSVESVIQGDRHIKEDYEMELSIKSKKGFLGIKQHLKYDDASFIEQVQIDGFEYNEAYVDVIIAQRKRVLNVSKPTEFSAAYDITHDVHINKDTKLPDFNDILLQAKDILNNDLIPNLYE
ncbi:hypothetical protein [Chitinophaga pinensis]|uniref:Uncharacterized protein n=1 Tax=Chitinophaga pinensis (strain ATCC 43595 / DSM 2588 / LMG 13176 / NBRC 15968 / NCIMB 11800 / UQM 2034) TaxID=485918 RepID=A0A979G514_CHIPD|nr:hypothetical protein [Chitinophaga pinensis]ACU60974.1 hypothetical protein Cpin_3510 [Chitinophaga pinensis DSM 2588]